jgi:anti-sigma B factor antagonist
VTGARPHDQIVTGASPQPAFHVGVERLPGDSYVVRVTGELDLYTAPRLENELEQLVRSEAAHVIVDLSETSFVDSSGLGVLLQAGGRLGRDRFALTGLGGETRRVFEITGADRVLDIVELDRTQARQPGV